MTRYLVLGGGGFIGRHVVSRLSRKGLDVTSVTHSLSPNFTPSVRTITRDLVRATPRQFDELISTVDVVFHFAWTSIPASANSSPIDDLFNNGKMTLELLEAMKRKGSGRLVFASSGGTVYGRSRNIPVREDHPLDPITAYGVSKLACEKYTQLYHSIHKVDARIVRIANPYGAGQNPLRQQGVVSTFVFQALKDLKIEIWGDGSVVRDFIYIEDLVDCLIKVSDAPVSAGELPLIYNIGGGERHTINSVIEFIESVTGQKLATVRRATRSFDVPISLLNIEKARNELLWTPRVGLKEGIRRMISDLRENASRKFANGF